MRAFKARAEPALRGKPAPEAKAKTPKAGKPAPPKPSPRGKRGARGPAAPRPRAHPLRAGLESLPWIALAAMAAMWPTQAHGGARLERRVRRDEPGRGRDARSPKDIPVRGWRDILWRTWQEFNKDRITTVAGGVTFFVLLAGFPGLAAFVSLYGIFADVHDAQKQIMLLAGVAPREMVVFIGKQMILISAARPATLSATFLLGLLLSVWSANSGMKALINGLNVAYEETERRTYLQLTLQSLVFTLGGVAYLAVCIGALVAIPFMLPFVRADAPWLDLIRWPLLLVLSMALLAVIYRFGPSRQHARWRWVTPGGAVASVLWLGASFAYSWYLSNFAHYDRTYGSFGAAAGAMTWMWMSTIIVLFGAELNAEIEHQTTVDSTTGRPLPMGQRGASMADTVGSASPKGAWLSLVPFAGLLLKGRLAPPSPELTPEQARRRA